MIIPGVRKRPLHKFEIVSKFPHKSFNIVIRPKKIITLFPASKTKKLG
jgi:hypothetical protein